MASWRRRSASTSASSASTARKLAFAAPHVRVMHPGPMNRGVEIDSDVADDLSVSLIQDQVEMGVAARMAVLTSLAARLDNDR
jgi:aspartate carbamoyltransferase catalytic subunit